MTQQTISFLFMRALFRAPYFFLVAFAGNIHSRYPMCVVGGSVGFNVSQTEPVMLQNMYSIISKVAIRNNSTEQSALLEGFEIIVYECNPPHLVPDMPPHMGPNSIFRANNVFDRMVSLLVQRYVK